MRRIACVLLCLALCCALFACGRAEPATTEPIITEIEITTEEETTTQEATTVFVPMSGESNGVTWRTVDLEDEANARENELVQSWESEHHPAEEWKYITELVLSDTVMVFETPTTSYAEIAGDEIRMRDSATGKETVLLKHSDVLYPALAAGIDARFFVFVWCAPVYGIGDSIIYDTKEKREVTLEYTRTGTILRFVCEANGKLYFREAMEEEPMPDGKPHVLCADVADLYKGKPLKAENVLEEFEVTGELGWLTVAPSGRYIAATIYPVYGETENYDLLLFDLETHKLAMRLPRPSGFGIDYMRFADAQTLYGYNYEGTRAVEITLP